MRRWVALYIKEAQRRSRGSTWGSAAAGRGAGADVFALAVESSVSPGAAEPSCSFKIRFFFFIWIPPLKCGVEPVRLRRGSGAAGSAGQGRPARSGGREAARSSSGARRRCFTGLAPSWSGPRSKTRLTRYLAG